MNAEREMLAETARLWAIRVGDPAFADWDAFAAWLEADPAHPAAYEAALDEHEAVDALFDVPPAPAWQQAAPAPPQPRPARWRMPAMAAGAALFAAVGGWYALDPPPAAQHYATAPGERREIALADGSRIILNGGTTLTLDRDNHRHVAMADGEALFEIRHSDRDPFVVTTADGTRLVDIGTVFNVGVEGGALDVGVSEGAVIYSGRGGELRVDAGEMLTRADADAVPVKRAVDREAVGGWRTGYLQYSEAPLRQVATDLTRNLGVPVEVDGALRARRFSGTLMLDGGADAVMARMGPLLDVRVDRRGEGWTMTSPDGARN